MTARNQVCLPFCADGTLHCGRTMNLAARENVPNSGKGENAPEPRAEGRRGENRV